MHPLTPFAIFLGSALLFCLQPMVGRTLLPAFGGSAAVWSVCLATFQVLLVGGYAYAHALSGWGAQRQRRVHVALLGVAAAWAFVIAGVGLAWARGNLHAGEHPALEVLLVVLIGVGVPYLVLSSGSSLLQAWASASAGADKTAGRGVYRLYAVSNLGSFFGLFAYPFLMEPYVPLRWQWLGWSAGVGVYLALVFFVARGKQKARADEKRDSLDAALADAARADDSLPEKSAPVALPRVLSVAAWWYVLPGLSSFMLVATTNHLSMDVAPMPLLWAILLGAFLLSYVAGFSRVGERWIPVWRVLALAALIGCGFAAQEQGGDAFVANIGAGTALVFFCGTFLHGWLYAIRPQGARLTRFYLGIAVGGALGGMAVSFLAPALFSGFWEYQITIFSGAAVLLVFAVCTWERVWYARIFSIATGVACMCACMLTFTAMRLEGRGIVLRERNFYGALKVGEAAMSAFDEIAQVFSLTNGGTLHGEQARGWSKNNAKENTPGNATDNMADFSRAPTTYYGPYAGGLALVLSPKWPGRAAEANGTVVLREVDTMALPKGKPMRVGAIGLGIGTMATWGRAGDVWRFFEINPLVDKVARDRRFFTYMSDSPAAPQTLIGDARLLLEREHAAGEPAYDVLIVDAYSGDSVPLHLATEEAFKLYASRLAPDGILAIHVSNWHMDLLPLCKAAARALGMHAVGVQSPENANELIEGAVWVYLSRKPLKVSVGGSGADLVDFSRVRDIRLPTDDWGSLQGLISFNYVIPVVNDETSDSE